MLISVIITIYNTSQYIERCINSLINQNLDEVELIFIDDCSTDSSLEVLQKCLKDNKSPNIHIIENQNNLGSGETRNIGIRKATGEYLIFIDSDDYVSEDYIAKLKQTISNSKSDIIIFDYTEINKTYRLYKKCSPAISKEQVIADLIQSKMHNSLCNKLFRRSLFIENDIFIPQGISMFEDKSICFRLFEKANTFFYINSSLYYYDRTRCDSLTTRDPKHNIDNGLLLLDVINAHYKQGGTSSLIQKAIFNNRILITGLIALFGDMKLRETYMPRIKEIKFSSFFQSASFPIQYKLAAFCYYYNLRISLYFLKHLYFLYRK